MMFKVTFLPLMSNMWGFCRQHPCCRNNQITQQLSCSLCSSPHMLLSGYQAYYHTIGASASKLDAGFMQARRLADASTQARCRLDVEARRFDATEHSTSSTPSQKARRQSSTRGSTLARFLDATGLDSSTPGLRCHGAASHMAARCAGVQHHNQSKIRCRGSQK